MAGLPGRETTRGKLIDAAFSLFRARGFEGVTIDEIAAEADVSRRTFFRYFEVKEAVVFPFDTDQQGLMAEEFLRLTNGLPAQLKHVRAIIDLSADEFIANAEEMHIRRRIIEESVSLIRYEHGVNLNWELLFARGFDGCIDAKRNDEFESPAEPSFRARVAAGLIFGAVNAAFREWYRLGVHCDLRALIDEAFVAINGPVSDFIGKRNTELA